MGWPRWQRGLLGGAVFAATWAIMALVAGEGWGQATIGGLVGGASFAIFSTRVVTRIEKDLNPPDGPALSTDERVEAYRAVGQGRPSTNPRVQAAAVTLARQLVDRRGRLGVLAVLFGFSVVVSVVSALLTSPRWWSVTVISVAVGVSAFILLGRQQERAMALLRSSTGAARIVATCCGCSSRSADL